MMSLDYSALSELHKCIEELEVVSKPKCYMFVRYLSATPQTMWLSVDSVAFLDDTT